MSGHKRRTLETMLEAGKVLVHLDARREGVDVPAHLRQESALGLQLSHKFDLDIFEIDESGVRANLSFQGRRHLCVLPWPAIFAIRSVERGKRVIFYDDAPADLLDDLVASHETTTVVKTKPNLRLVS